MSSVAIIVPLYNKLPYIERCMRSIFAQTHGDFELIVVDDGSTDGSADIVAICDDPRLRLVRQANAGPGAARNHGMRLATAPYAAFLDADDEWHPEYLANALAHFSRPGLLAVNCGMRILPEDTTTEQRWRDLGLPLGRFRLPPDADPRLVVAFLANMLPSSCVLDRKAALDAGGFYGKDRCLFSEDAHLYLKLLLTGEVLMDPKPFTIRHEDASELALNRKDVRQVEPFLRDPEDILATCPPAYLPLAQDTLAARALKTASVYGYHGKSGEARRLFARFVAPGRHWRLPYFATALLSLTPLAGLAGALLSRSKSK